MKKINWCLFILSLVLVSCEKEPAKEEVEFPSTVSGGIFIVNEGNFQSGNATLDFLDFGKQTVSFDVFGQANGRPLGDVFQSAVVHNGNAYLVVNNSQKIEVVNTEDFKSVATITGFISPRYMLVANNTKAYVSEYYTNVLRVVDLQSNTIVQNIPFNGWSEGMGLVDDKLYVTGNKTKYVYVINTTTETVEDSIKVGTAPCSIEVDKNQKVWVLCSGGTDHVAGLYRIDPDTKQVEATFDLTAQNDYGPIKLKINKEKDKLYWLNKHVYTIDINATQSPAGPLVPALQGNLWGLGVDPKTGEIYVADAIDFVQRSTVNRYNTIGELKGSFKAGLITGDFCFYYK